MKSLELIAQESQMQSSVTPEDMSKGLELFQDLCEELPRNSPTDQHYILTSAELDLKHRRNSNKMGVLAETIAASLVYRYHESHFSEHEKELDSRVRHPRLTHFEIAYYGGKLNNRASEIHTPQGFRAEAGEMYSRALELWERVPRSWVPLMYQWTKLARAHFELYEVTSPDSYELIGKAIDALRTASTGQILKPRDIREFWNCANTILRNLRANNSSAVNRYCYEVNSIIKNFRRYSR